MKNKLAITIIFIVGFVLRLYPTIKQPLWLDEVYSLYFATNFTFLQTIFHLPDCHPGLFYLLLKSILNFTTSTLYLRLIFGMAPQIIAGLIIHRRYRNKLVTAAFLFNPFFVLFAWQIRMYSLIILVTTIVFSINYQKKFSSLTLVLWLFVANLLSYSFIIPTICLGFYLGVKKKYTWFIIIPLVIIQFFVFKGSNYKSYTETASWISPPSISSAPMVLLTMFGLNTDLNAQFNYSLGISILLSISIGYIFFKFSKRYDFFLFNFTIPLILSVLLSITFPFLSQHRFFYLFIPKISIFLPRFLLPFSVIFTLYLLRDRTRINLTILVLLIIAWPQIYRLINYKSPYPTVFPTNKQGILLPPWENLRLNDQYQLDDIKLISARYNKSLELEAQLLDPKPNCQLYASFSQITYIDQPIVSLDNYQLRLKNSIKNCSKSL